ncbi:hypothetical protein SLS62_002076 [Diatrype stigma]|uniref:PA14 domain-containing protein n=1 Tax=Diatrype stigma TaxID=117547 RepID=A0AAN9UY93_9PEZI
MRRFTATPTFLVGLAAVILTNSPDPTTSGGTSSLRPTTTTGGATPVNGLPPLLATIAAPELSTACSCLGIPIPVTTQTNTATVTPSTTTVVAVTPLATSTPTTTATEVSIRTVAFCPPAPTTSPCANTGLEWAEYYNFRGPNYDPTYIYFVPSLFKDVQPNIIDYTTAVSGIYVIPRKPISVYGNPTQFDSVQYVLAHRGYIFAKLTGTYTITVEAVDDSVFIWWGPFAYSGWERENANLFVSYDTDANQQGAGSATFNMVEGEYMAMRIMYVQGQGQTVFNMNIVDPNGGSVVSPGPGAGPGPTTSDYLVRYSCDQILAPVFPPWGSET